MLIYEDFIIDLLQNDLIYNYTSGKQDTRKYYNTNYREKAGCSFHKFCYKSWLKWYILDFKTRFIYFDQRWLIYLSKSGKAQDLLKVKTFLEDKFCDSQSCKLCLVKFPGKNVYEDHRKSLKHKVRVEYLRNKENLKNSGRLKCKLITASNTAKGNDSLLKLKFERNVTTTKVIEVTNTAETTIEIIEVIHINPYQKDVEVYYTKFEKAVTLEHGEEFQIFIKGHFENSKSYILPVVVACRTCEKEEINYILIEILVEITSEFSYLKPKLPYVKPSKAAYLPSDDEIIRAKTPLVYKSYYKEVYPLQSFQIPMDLLMKLRNLIKAYPNFIERMPLNIANNFFCNEFAKKLKLNPQLKEENYCDLLNTLVSIEENQIKVDIRQYDTMAKLTFIERNTYALMVPGLAEARPSLIIHDAVYVKEKENDCQKYQGVVTQVFESSVRLNFNRKYNRFSEIYDKNKKFHIEFGYSRRPIRVQKQALLLTKEHDIVSYFYPKRNLEDIKDNNIKEITYFNPNLNEEQRGAVRNILNERRAPYIIFGPPGTGKTLTVVESVLQVWKNKPHARILICAPSNSATNEIAIRLAKNLNSTELFRLIGNTYGQDRRLAQIKDIVNISKDGSFYMPSMETILKYRILLTTLVTAARLVNGGVPYNYYSHVFIDESGYATESESLIPIAGILSNSMNRGRVVGQIVLAGDPRQLGPVIHSVFVKYCGFGKSMLERLIDTCPIYARDENRPVPYNENYVTKLVKNYRSHRKILKVPNTLFYHNELISAGSESSNMFTNWEHLMTPGFPVIFHHTVGEDSRESNSPSFFNIQEIEDVVAYVKKLVGCRVNEMEIIEDDIGIITPYRKQAKMLQKACVKQGWNNLLVGSVEQFQGKEKLIIIVSTVRSKNFNKYEEIDKKCQLGFVRNPKRFNVALTRAKALLIVVGNGDVLKNDNNWLHFLNYCIREKSVAGSQFYLSDEEYLKEEISSKVVENCNNKDEVHNDVSENLQNL